LAAIAIPKLFGMSAKAKAQEVGPSAGTWIKLQQAYKMETGHFGTAKNIAYKLPGGNLVAIDYDAGAVTDSTSNFLYEVDADIETPEWKATSKFNSDPCEQGKIWNVKFDDDKYEDPIVDIDEDGCRTLTPNWCNIGRKGGTVCK